MTIYGKEEKCEEDNMLILFAMLYSLGSFLFANTIHRNSRPLYKNRTIGTTAVIQ
jgi:hypothetical protein